MGDPNYSIVENRASAIDPEGVGPFPPNTDDRQRDVFQDQEDRINGRRTEAESVTEDFAPPTAFDLSGPPPMPDLPFASTQSIEDAAAEAARAAVNDALRNMTINGVSPNVSDGGVSFDIPVEPSASAAFAAMNAMPDMDPPLPETPAIVPMPQPTVEIDLPEVPESPPLPVTPDPSPTETPETTEMPQDDIGGGGAQVGEAEIVDPPTGDSPQGEQDPSVEAAPSEAQSNAPEVEEDAKKSDPEGVASSQRQKGEMRGEYEERQKQIKQVMQDEGAAKALATGDTSYLNSGYVPVLFKRKDGDRKILVQIENSISSVIEGAVGGERTRDLPEDSGYYISGEETIHPFKVYQRSINRKKEVQIESSSKIYKDIESFEGLSISGLNTWTEIKAGYVYVKGTIKNLVPSDLKIEWGESSLPKRIEKEDQGGVNIQTSFVLPIAFIYKNKNEFLIRQEASTNYTMIQACIDGVPVVVPIAT